LIIGGLAVYVFYLAPAFVGLIIDEFTAFMLSQAAIATMQLVLLVFFFFGLMMPLSQMLQQMQVGQLEIFLAAPVQSKDVLLGRFMGRLLFYAIFITLIAGLFTALLYPLGLDLLQVTIIVVIFIITMVSAMWLGTVIAAVLVTKLGKSKRGSDIGKAIGVLIALPMIGLMYAIMGGGLIEALNDPATSGVVQAVLGMFPSSWGADVIMYFASSPGNISTAAFDTLTRFVGLIAFFVVVLLLGTKVATRAYSMEPSTTSEPKVKTDGFLYRTIRFIGGGKSFGTLLVSVFKEYGRRMENLSWVAYVVGLIVLITVFLADADEDPWEGVVMFLFILPFLAAAVASDVTLRGKDNLFIFRKAPRGEGRFVRAMVVKGWLVALPITAALVIAMQLLNPHTLYTLLEITGFTVQTVAAQLLFALGLFLLLPVPGEDTKDKNMTLVMVSMVMMMVNMVLFFTTLIFTDDMVTGLFCLYAPITWLLGITFLFLGTGKLRWVE